ncbi:GNAT family N-acetyltransferase [Sporolactobacillus pectinivorans]|uniref:GNAT family N-acetyltransferase n=1 Tax=Sporolactobacillus pectinivorans TaxID=1591408 RepID=UPI000C260BA5|nr:GNAT family N-acetyltransferase [Sporolactobacillus pectinivorans]
MIREYCEKDEESWLRCRVLSFLHTAYYDNVLRRKEKYSHSSVELVAIESGQVVGLIDVEYEREPKTVCTLCSSLGGMIWNIAVHPDFQRRGIGAQLLLAAEQKLKERDIFELEAWTRDDPWVNDWYRKNGFKKISSYLHVFIEGEEVHDAVHSSIAGLKPLEAFAHYSGEDSEKIRKKFNRVHECRGYYKKLQ